MTDDRGQGAVSYSTDAPRWGEGHHSHVYRFECRRNGAVVAVVEVEEYDHGEADARDLRPRDDQPPHKWIAGCVVRYGSASDALAAVADVWGVTLGKPLVDVRADVRGDR